MNRIIEREMELRREEAEKRGYDKGYKDGWFYTTIATVIGFAFGNILSTIIRYIFKI